MKKLNKKQIIKQIYNLPIERLTLKRIPFMGTDKEKNEHLKKHLEELRNLIDL